MSKYQLKIVFNVSAVSKAIYIPPITFMPGINNIKPERATLTISFNK